MKLLIGLALLAALASAYPSQPKLVPYVVNPGGIGGIYKGPDSATIIKGPDGSVVKSKQIGGAVVVDDVHPVAGSLISSGILVDDLDVGRAVPFASISPVGHSGVIQAGPVRTGSITAGLGAYGGSKVVDPLIYDDLNVDIIHATPVGSSTLLGGASAGVIHAGPVSTGAISAGPVSTGTISAGPLSSGAIHDGVLPLVAPLAPIALEAGLLSPGVLRTGPLHAPILPGPTPIAPIISAPGTLHSGPVSTGSVVVGPSRSGAVLAGPSSVGTVLTAPSDVAVVGPIQPAVGPIVPPLIHSNEPIIVDDLVIAKDPKIVDEHVIVGNKVITVPKLVEEDTDLVGPSGTISTRGGDAVIAGPASTTIKGGGVVTDVQKQSELHVNALEVKPLVSNTPVVLQPKPILPVTKVYAPQAPILNPIHPIIGPTVLKAGPVPLPLSAVNLVPPYAPSFVKYPHY